MRYYFIWLLLIAAGTNAQVSLNNGLVAYYPFNGNAKDESGNNIQPSEVKKNTGQRFTINTSNSFSPSIFFE